MNERTKRILIIVGFILSVIVIATVMYIVFFGNPISPQTEQPVAGDETSTGLPSANDGSPRVDEEPTGDTNFQESDPIAQGGITKVTTLTTHAVHNTNISSDGKNVNFYNPADGRFYAMDENGEVVSLSDKQFPEVENAEWNKDANKAVLEFPDGSNVVYNFDTEKQVTLPKHWEEFQFSPVTDEIIAKSMGLDVENRWLVTTNDDATNTKTIAALGENEKKVDVSWSPNDHVVAFADTAAEVSGGISRNMIVPIGKNKENYKGLIIEGFDFEDEWSPNGRQLLYSTVSDYSDYKPLLWIVDATSSTMGENRRSVPLNTWAEKCTWKIQTTIYCAVPQSLQTGAGFAQRVSNTTPDSLYKINSATGAVTLVAVPEVPTTIKNIIVSDNEDILYYTNNSNGRLEKIDLK